MSKSFGFRFCESKAEQTEQGQCVRKIKPLRSHQAILSMCLSSKECQIIAAAQYTAKQHGDVLICDIYLFGMSRGQFCFSYSFVVSWSLITQTAMCALCVIFEIVMIDLMILWRMWVSGGVESLLQGNGMILSDTFYSLNVKEGVLGMLVHREINNSHPDTLFKAGTQRRPGSV